MFRVEDATDLHRIAIGLNSNRGSLTEQLEVLGITPEDIETSGLVLEQTPGDTQCHHANSRHYDIIHDEAAIEQLVRILVESGREDHRFKKQMKRAAEAAQMIGCHATKSDDSACQCQVIP